MSFLTLNEGAAPTTPATGKGAHYESTTAEPHFINAAGVDMNLAPNRKFNWIRNSGMWFAQRQGGALTTYSNTSGRSISADGWGITNENASAQYARTDTQNAPEAGLVGRYYGQFTKITSSGKLVVTQVLEGSDTAVLRGSTVRIQIWAKGIITAPATWRLGLVQLNSSGTVDSLPATFISAFNSNGTDPTLGTNLAYIAPKSGVTPDNGTVVGNAVSLNVTSSWQRFGAVFDVPSDCKNLVLMVWSDSQAIATAGIAMSQESLTDGEAIQDWAPQSYSLELGRVQRYYCKSFAIDTAPANNVSLAGNQRGYVSVAGATANQPIGIRFPENLRTTSPTLTFYNPAAANAFTRNTTAGSDATATSAANTTDSGTDVLFTGIAAWTVSQAVAIHYSADAEL